MATYRTDMFAWHCKRYSENELKHKNQVQLAGPQLRLQTGRSFPTLLAVIDDQSWNENVFFLEQDKTTSQFAL